MNRTFWSMHSFHSEAMPFWILYWTLPARDGMVITVREKIPERLNSFMRSGSNTSLEVWSSRYNNVKVPFSELLDRNWKPGTGFLLHPTLLNARNERKICFLTGQSAEIVRRSLRISIDGGWSADAGAWLVFAVLCAKGRGLLYSLYLSLSFKSVLSKIVVNGVFIPNPTSKNSVNIPRPVVSICAN